MKALHAHIKGIVMVAGFSWLACSLNQDIEPVQWQMHVEVPITNRNITIGELLPAGSYSGLDVAFGDSTASGDTLSISKTDSMKCTMERDLKMLDTCFFGKKLGVCKLSRLPPVECVFAPGTGVSDVKVINAPLPSPLTLSLSKKVVLPGVNSMTIDEHSPEMSIAIVNYSKSADMEDVAIALLDNQEVIGIFHVAHLPAQSSKKVALSIAGKCIRSPVSIAACITFRKGAVLRQEDRFSVSFSLNNQGISEAVIVDSLLEYADNFSGNIAIADSLRLEVIEIDSTLLRCELYCPALLKMEVSASLASNGDGRHRVTSDTLSNTSSTGMMEEVINDTLFSSPGDVHGVMALPIRARSFFPSWNARLGQSFIGCRFAVRSLPDGRLIKFNKNDMLMIRLMHPNLPIIRIGGCLTKALTQSFTTKMKVGTSVKSVGGDSLQRALYFESARLHLDFASGLPQGSSIDSLLVRICMKNPSSLQDSSVVTQKLVNLLPNSHHAATVDFTGLFNTWPDTLAFTTQIILPPGAGVSVYNPYYRDNHAGAFALKINPSLVWKLTVPLCWKNDDTKQIELERSSLSLKSDQLEWIKKLEEPRVRIMLSMLNKTHLNVTLFAIGAAGCYKDELMSVPASLVGSDTIPGHLFLLLGKNGLRLAPCDKEITTVVHLDKRGIDALLSQDSCAIRWFLTIPTRKTGALLATDYCSLKATGLIDGIGRTDSLLYIE